MSKKTILKYENAEPLKAEELLKEIKLLLKENYVAKLYLRGSELSMTFLSGQKFTLTLYETRYYE